MDGISVLWCLRRVNANGKRNEFRAYCDQALIPTWCEVWTIYSYFQALTKLSSLTTKKPSNSSRQTAGRRLSSRTGHTTRQPRTLSPHHSHFSISVFHAFAFT
ncbi:hypothetical protein SCLCIDRAFT_714631 [Scleroderma citrinum Foug A]|uniref:Uncharacterized protein n=1 Tax=Scleroderma citrinum Foug A TaxID=1036808 RepID=A0A0C3EN49_9AGAM|nr:hypothetical protein SCLCIDRAFT_714631 [Scleroderma citrinum Foug A]